MFQDRGLHPLLTNGDEGLLYIPPPPPHTHNKSSKSKWLNDHGMIPNCVMWWCVPLGNGGVCGKLECKTKTFKAKFSKNQKMDQTKCI